MMYMRIYVLLVSLTLFLFLLGGCAPRDVVTEDEEDVFTDSLREYEREFDPSDYNAPFAISKEEEAEPREVRDHAPETDEPDAPEFTQGFRIQLYSTSDMEAAQEVHEVADSIFIDHWIYIVYEVPFYKVRLGDFETRPLANRVLTNVVREGFRDAWIVPDRVLKDPPEKIIEVENDEDADDNDVDIDDIIEPPER